MSEISSPHQKTSKEGAEVREIRHNERRNISPKSNADNRVVIVIDDTPPASPIRESSQAKEDRGNRTKEIQMTTNIGKGKNNTSNYKNPDKASRKVTVSIGDKATKKQMDYRAENRDRFSYRSPSPRRHRTRYPSGFYRRPSSPLDMNKYRQENSSRRLRPSLSPQRRGRPNPPRRRVRSASPKRRSPSPTVRIRKRLPSPLLRDCLRIARLCGQSIPERKLKLSEKQDRQSIPSSPVSSQNRSIPAPQAESSLPPLRVPVSNPQPVMTTPQPGPNRSSSAMRHSAYGHFTPNYISIIKSMDALPIKVMENFGHMNKTLPAGQDTTHFEAKEGGQTGMTDDTLIETDRDDNVIGKDMLAMKENTPEAVEVPTPAATESSKPVLTKTTNPAVADKILPVVLYTPKPVVSMFSYLQNHTDSRNKEYGNQPSLKNNDINSGSGNIPIAPASVRFVEKHSASDDLGGTRKKVARLLPPWKVKMTDMGDIYYYNPITGATSETRPA
ncbi:uncharacterized protein EV154DRAFT_522486 [Mucor mucedo]|uniref:uncharacterized protein n=1 Tax=Mucor mucedo TaxID=29922 RepID=UPI00221FC98A|nr:uncharacterized protein EV154DRAFT_522486 [Mucor mucedo]KAI7883815.1 hypothetical protein EV154DRAFT_522486 [Mucor mucedo]